MMLATISHSMPPSTYPPSSGPLPAMATQLPITVAQRPKPKLSVNTAQPRSFGKGASLRLDTLSAVSPTKINTFSNAYPALERPSKPRLSIDSSIPNAPSTSASPSTTAPAATTPTPSSASTLSSAVTCTSQESHESATISIPYKQPHNLVSILANSPVHSIIPRKMAASRPMFPAEKRVSFRTPLEEEITTVKYTLAHSDLEASVSTLSTLASTESDSSAPAKHSDSDGSCNVSLLSSDKSASTSSSLESSPRPKHPRIGDKRDSSSSEDEESDTCPETPVAGRRKRTRDWRWTLGPISGSDKSASSTASDATSEDSS